ncbi:sterol desaturase family protein [Flavilitoribacter nigricans]|uniref:Sterol desaturase n=1 Tax=Flavilitoribacter nigricans (strain ATCC 23147 / DSM 23189 / NBRC 102662 / NCIMB 1420 / SS-2) TaxID=1122177 RepID=A0A2D0N7I2_FLAN2|nr:sterol desaturase family protein [Flavilitoribacter nigricans]PHN04089.1 sterol desaturase [Flavilitoribacter nigricans DSM 23189 = NBRC 102662]
MESFLNTPFLEPYHFFRLTLIFFVIVFMRYLIVSGVYHYIFYVWFRPRVAHRILNLKPKQEQQIRMEIRRSAITSVIFAFSATALIILWQQGYTHITTDWSAFPWWYHPLSLFIALFIHETYYYWLHRWMHRPKIYRKVHKWHHDSIETSSLTSFSFHPTESILQAIVVPLIVIFLPMHLYVLFVLLFIMTISGTINHAGVEIYPKSFLRNPVAKWIIGATHHDLHHKQFRFNYGLYFTFWDKWMGTESPDYEKIFQQKTEPDTNSTVGS